MGTAGRASQLSMNEFGMLAEVVGDADGHDGSFEAGSAGGMSQGYAPHAAGAGGGGSGGGGGAAYRYHGTSQEGARSLAGEMWLVEA